MGNRTSLITDPPDGRVPALTPEGQQRREANAGGAEASPGDRTSRIDRCLERCITYGSPQLVAGYQSLYPDRADTRCRWPCKTEMITTGACDSARWWSASSALQSSSGMGDSRGHWEGDTLVVDTTNYKPRKLYESISSEKLHVIERFSRSGPGEPEI